MKHDIPNPGSSPPQTTASIYRKGFVRYAAIAAIVQLPTLAVEVLLYVFVTKPAFVPATTLLQLCLFLIAWHVMCAALTVAMDNGFHGKAPSVGTSYRAVWPRLPALGISALLLGSVVLGTFGVVTGVTRSIVGNVFNAANPYRTSVLALAFSIFVFIPLFFAITALVGLIMVRFIFFVHTTMLEGRGMRAGLAQSMRLVAKAYWFVVWRVVLMVLLGGATLLAVVVVVSQLSLFFGSSTDGGAVFGALAVCLWQILVVPFLVGMLSSLYRTLRARSAEPGAAQLINDAQ